MQCAQFCQNRATTRGPSPVVTTTTRNQQNDNSNDNEFGDISMKWLFCVNDYLYNYVYVKGQNYLVIL